MVGGNHSNQGDGTFLMPWDITQSGTENNVNVPVSSGTASHLVVLLSSALTGSQTTTLTVRKNGVNTLLACTVSAPDITCTNVTDQVTFATGDVISLLWNEANTPNVRIKYSFRYSAQ